MQYSARSALWQAPGQQQVQIPTNVMLVILPRTLRSLAASVKQPHDGQAI